MIEDKQHSIREIKHDPQMDQTPEIYNNSLIWIDGICILISNTVLMNLGMPSPNRPVANLIDNDLQQEQQFVYLATVVATNEQLPFTIELF